jgi:tRNA dimethylallyltransferase
MKTFHSKEEYLRNVLSHLDMPLDEKVPPTNKRKRVIIIAGPTGVGKTDLSIDIGQVLAGEIISGDSVQIYKEMDIGTAKATKDQIKKLPHHLIDVRDISQNFNVVDFYNEAHKICREILLNDKVPILVGGSGFYIHTFLYGPPYGPPSNAQIRKRLEKQLNEMGADVLYERLQILDPEYAKTITENDRHKIIRALEIILITERPVSQFPKPNNLNDIYDFRCWFVYKDRQKLYQGVEERCMEMIERGFIEEVKKLQKMGIESNNSASNAIGYRDCLAFLKTKQTKEDMQKFIEDFKKSTRHYIKRQFTWFRKEPLFRWIDIDKLGIEKTKEYILQDFEQGK